MSICNDAKSDNKLLSRPVSPLGGEDSTNSSEKSTISQEQMSESGISNYEDPKSEQVQDGRWTREEHYRFLKAVAIYGREVRYLEADKFISTSRIVVFG